MKPYLLISAILLTTAQLYSQKMERLDTIFANEYKNVALFFLSLSARLLPVRTISCSPTTEKDSNILAYYRPNRVQKVIF